MRSAIPPGSASGISRSCYWRNREVRRSRPSQRAKAFGGIHRGKERATKQTTMLGRWSERDFSVIVLGGRGGSFPMKHYTAVVERDPETGLYKGYVPGFPGAHSQGETLDELNRNLREVIEMLLEDGDPRLEAEFVGIQSITIAA